MDHPRAQQSNKQNTFNRKCSECVQYVEETIIPNMIPNISDKMSNKLKVLPKGDKYCRSSIITEKVIIKVKMII